MYMTILQTQSTTGAALEIIVMLLGAALIGVLTTYFFMKNKYDKIIHSLQSELEQTVKERDKLSAELTVVNQDLDKKTKELEEFNQKYNELVKREEDRKKSAAKGKTGNK